MKIDLAAIRARCDAAAPGPWEFGDGEYTGWIINPEEELIIGGNPCEGAIEDDDPNVIFIAHARTDIPALLNEVERLQAQLAAAHSGALEWVSYPDNVSKMYPELNPKIRPELGRWIIIEKAGNEERALDYFCLVCNEWVVLQKGDRWAYLPTPLEVTE